LTKKNTYVKKIDGKKRWGLYLPNYRNFEMKVEYFGKSDIGKVRSRNEDYFINKKIDKNEYIFIVADGMGGHNAGGIASELGTLTFINQYKYQREKKKLIIDSMIFSIKKANETIYKKALSDPKKSGMGTTLSACVISNMRAYIVHVGDSRIYLIRDNDMKRVTTDHTFVEKMVEQGKITDQQALHHPQKNILYMSLGVQKSFEPEVINDFKIKDNDVIVMCSDGLVNTVTINQIKEFSLTYKPQESVEKLIKLANKNGGTDNITVQIIHIKKTEGIRKLEPISVEKENKKNSMILLFFIILTILFILWLILKS